MNFRMLTWILFAAIWCVGGDHVSIYVYCSCMGLYGLWSTHRPEAKVGVLHHVTFVVLAIVAFCQDKRCMFGCRDAIKNWRPLWCKRCRYFHWHGNIHVIIMLYIRIYLYAICDTMRMLGFLRTFWQYENNSLITTTHYKHINRSPLLLMYPFLACGACGVGHNWAKSCGPRRSVRQ